MNINKYTLKKKFNFFILCSAQEEVFITNLLLL